jgi:hypothetical protein
MASDFASIKVTGLKGFAKGLKQMDAELPKALRLAFNEVAEPIAEGARAKVPRRSGRAARSIQVRSTRTEVRIVAGGPRAPYYPWLDFGGRVGRKRATRRAFYREGRYIYPTYYEQRDEIPKRLELALVNVARLAGLEVT